MKNLHDEIDLKFRTETNYQKSEIKRGYDRIQFLEDKCAAERANRVQSLADYLAPINAQIDTNLKDTRQERVDRVAAERQILDNLKADARKIEDAIDTEKAERMEM